MFLDRKIFFILFILPVLFAPFQINNTCKTYMGYFNIFFSTDCYYSPDLDDDIIDIIRRHVGFCETHQVQTEDGYILGLFRIPKANPKGVILLQHPIHFDATIWVSQYNESIAFLFWKAGYDVWMGNSRGTKYSKKHVSWTPSDAAFWNYRFVFFWILQHKKSSFHEMGYYDHPATIDYIKRKTNQSNIIYLGYSLGGTTGLIYASTRPEEAANSLRIMVTMAPVTYIQTTTSIAKYIIPNFFRLMRIFNLDLHSSMLRNDVWYTRLAKTMLSAFPWKKGVVYLNGLITGWTPDEFDPNLINMLIKKIDTEFFLKLWHHANQIYLSDGVFRMYDYEAEGNLNLYGTKRPPSYPLEKIKLPVFLVYGQNDSLTTSTDNEKMYSKLPTESKINGKLLVNDFSHSDFAFGRRRNEKVYNKILRLFEEISL